MRRNSWEAAGICVVTDVKITEGACSPQHWPVAVLTVAPWRLHVSRKGKKGMSGNFVMDRGIKSKNIVMNVRCLAPVA
jgi:hypothetical protein